MKMINIKKIFAAVLTTVFVAAGLISCKDTLEEQYLNPEKTTEPSIGKFFTKMLNNNRVRPDYWNIRTFLVMHPGVYTNTVSYTNVQKRYEQQLSYLDDFWKDYYTPRGNGISGVMAHMREIEKEYSALTGQEKANAEVYLHAARVIFYDQTAKMVDLWGDIPFSQAGMLNLTGETVAPAFDSAEEIYQTLINGLNESASYFAGASLEPLVASAFSRQDILLKGNLDMWRRFANSLRLRLLMRISFHNENLAKTQVMEMLNNSTGFPLIVESNQNVLLDPLLTYTDFMRNAVTESNSHVAPEFLLDGVLKPASDPRIRVLFDKNVSNKKYNADYYSMPANLSASQQEANIAAGKYAILDSTTFLMNTKFPGIVITSYEVNFLKAEAQERWGTTAAAQAAYEKAVGQAVEFTFYLNKVGADFNEEDPEASVTPAEITALLAQPTVSYIGTKEEKLAKIWTQKWVSLGFIQSIEAWAEVRRTNYPVLTFVPDNTPGSELPPSRLLYPGSEKVYNASNYEKIAASDTRNTKIFWDIN